MEPPDKTQFVLRDCALTDDSSSAISAIDLLVQAGNPEQLDRDVQALPGCTAAVVGGPAGPFPQVEGAYVVRVFAGKDALEFMLEHQGYGKVIRELDKRL